MMSEVKLAKAEVRPRDGCVMKIMNLLAGVVFFGCVYYMAIDYVSEYRDTMWQEEALLERGCLTPVLPAGPSPRMGSNVCQWIDCRNDLKVEGVKFDQTPGQGPCFLTFSFMAPDPVTQHPTRYRVWQGIDSCGDGRFKVEPTLPLAHCGDGKREIGNNVLYLPDNPQQARLALRPPQYDIYKSLCFMGMLVLMPLILLAHTGKIIKWLKHG